MDKHIVEDTKKDLERCRLLIEEKLAWGSSDAWHGQEFEALAEQIYIASNVQLSVTTLKRVWGKVQYHSLPSISTRNALACYLGYPNWAAFREANQGTIPLESQEQYYQLLGSKIVKPALAIGLILVLGLTIFASLPSKKNIFSSAQLAQCSFSSQPLVEGLPNTVVFSYQLPKQIQEDVEQLVIQQYWDETKRIEVDKDGARASGIYYFPGYFRAKLLVDGQIAKEHDLFIRTKGWIATYGVGEIPNYLFSKELNDQEGLKLPQAVLSEIEELIQTQASQQTYHLVQPFDSLSADNFELHANFRQVLKKGKAICQTVKVFVLGTKGAMIIPFSALGCVGSLNVMMNDNYLKGAEHDFSAFGRDLSDWQDFKLEVKGKVSRIYMNGELLREIPYQETVGEVVGLRFKFAGAGELKNVKLLNQNGDQVYQSPF